MSTRRFGLRCVGLIAAYAIALQSLLAVGAALPLWAATSPAQICVGLDDADSPVAPGHHDSLQCCLASVCHGWAGVVPAIGAAVPARDARTALQPSAAAPAFAGISAGRPNWPRAPPV